MPVRHKHECGKKCAEWRLNEIEYEETGKGDAWLKSISFFEIIVQKSKIFAREICVCVHLTQTRDAQGARTEMSISIKWHVTIDRKAAGLRVIRMI